MKPLVLLDQDGPLGGFDQRFWQRCGEEGITLDCALHEQHHRYGVDHIPDRAERARARALVDAPGWFADLPVVEGSVDGLNHLAEVAEVWICSKPLPTNPTCHSDKAAWLGKNYGAKWADRLILAPDKSMIFGHLLVDDAPKISWLARAPWLPVIFRTSWNGAGSDWERLLHWDWTEDVDTLIDYVWRTNA